MRPVDGIKYKYRFTNARSQADRELTILHEVIHMVGNGVFSDELLGSLILGRSQTRVTKPEGSEALTAFLERNCR